VSTAEPIPKWSKLKPVSRLPFNIPNSTSNTIFRYVIGVSGDIIDSIAPLCFELFTNFILFAGVFVAKRDEIDHSRSTFRVLFLHTVIQYKKFLPLMVEIVF